MRPGAGSRSRSRFRDHMFARIANILGWAGVALVFAAVATWLAASPSCVTLRRASPSAASSASSSTPLSQWREMAARSPSGRRATARCRSPACSSCSASCVGAQLPGQPAEQALGSDLVEGVHALGSDAEVPAGPQGAAASCSCSSATTRCSRSAIGSREYTYLSKQVTGRVPRPRQGAGAGQAVPDRRPTAPSSSSTRSASSGSRPAPASRTSPTAIIKAVQGQQSKVYFVAGHGEHDPASATSAGYNRATAALQRDNYTVEKLALAQQPEVPADAAVVVVAGPTRDYLPPEIEALRRYLNKGGKAAPDARSARRADAPPLTNLIALAREWGIEVGNNVVVDAAASASCSGAARRPGGRQLSGHPITERFNASARCSRWRARSPPVDAAAARTAQTSSRPASRAGPRPTSRRSPSGGRVALRRRPPTSSGPVAVGAAVSADAPSSRAAPPPPAPGAPPPPTRRSRETRVVVFGDSDFAANDALGSRGNRDLSCNTINWLAQQENLIAIRPTRAGRSPRDADRRSAAAGRLLL